MRVLKLSIVTITYNDPSGLAETVRSLRPLLRALAPGEWEHVVVDSSPAVNRPLLEGLPGGWPLVHLEQPRQGIYAAFNRALAHVRGKYIWFLNGGDGLHDLAALSRALRILDEEGGPDIVCGGAYRRRAGIALYPSFPRRRFLANILGRPWMCHQAMISRREALQRVGVFRTDYEATGDYEYAIRCYLAGLRARFIDDVLVDYDMGGASSDVASVFGQFREIQKLHRERFPRWVRWANEIIRRVEYGRVGLFRRLSATRAGAVLRPLWWRANRARPLWGFRRGL
jgi:glycosyltransferase involved in cell wall biosynthesis